MVLQRLYWVHPRHTVAAQNDYKGYDEQHTDGEANPEGVDFDEVIFFIYELFRMDCFIVPPRNDAKRQLQLRQNFLHDFTVKEVDDAVGIAGVTLGVGHHDDGGAFLVEVGEQLHHLLAVLGIQVTSRLIGEDEFWVGYHGTGDGYTLLLAARQLLREVVLAVPDVHARHDGLHTLLALGGRDVHVA